MASKNLKIVVAVLVAVVVIAAVASIVLSTPSAESSDVMIEMGVDADGADKTVILTASSDVFDDKLSEGDLYVYYCVLDSYVKGTFFDYDAFIEDIEKEGVWDEDLQQKLPSNTVRADPIKLEILDSKNICIGFQADCTYAAYMVAIAPGILDELNAGYLVSLIDVPEYVYEDHSPRLKIVGKVHENMDEQTIFLQVENTDFQGTVSAEDITLLASFSMLDIVRVELVDSTRLLLHTAGYLSKGTSATGVVRVSEDATDSGIPLTASCDISDHFISVDVKSFQLKDGVLSFVVKVSNDILDNLDLFALGLEEYDIKDSEFFLGDDGSNCIRLFFDVGTDDLNNALCAVNGQYLVPYDSLGEAINDLGIPVIITDPVCSVIVESVVASGTGHDVTATISASYGFLSESLTPDNLSIEGNFVGVSGIVLTPSGNDYSVKFHVEGLEDPYLDAMVIIKKGVVTLWGETVDESAVVILYNYAPTLGALSSDEMIKKLYDNMEFSKIFSKIGYGIQGIQLIVNILGATGVIDMRSATDIAIAEINVKCDEIKKMLADQAVTLDRMNKKLDQIVEMLHEQRLLDLSNIYGSYRSASNDLANAIYVYSSAIKSDIWGFVQGDHDGKTFYIYFTDECKPSVMRGDFFTEHKTGVTIDGKSILPAYTIGVTVEKDVTFSESRTDIKFGSNTEKHMVNDLVRYVKDHVIKDGSSTYDVTNGNTTRSYTAEQLAQEIYNCMVSKYTEVEANSQSGEDVLDYYYIYTQTMASLVVNADGSITIDFDLRSNPVLAATEIMQSNYNFEKEAHANLKALNDSFTLYLYNYTMLAQSIEQLNTGSAEKVSKHFDASMKFLSEHRGYDTSTGYNPKTFCYVTGTNVRSDFRDISAQARYHSKDGFDHAVDDEPHDIKFTMKDLYTGDVSGKVLISDVQLNKIKANYDRIYADDPNKESFALYLGGQLEGERFLRDRLIVQWDGLQTYNDGYHVKLYSNMNLVNPGHSAQLMDSGSIYEISGTMDKSGFLNQFKAYSSEVYGKYYVAGKAYSLGSCSYVGKTCNCDNCLYAVGFFCKHVSAWTNDESALLTCEKDVPNCSRITERAGNDWTVGSGTTYTVIILG